MQKTTNIPSVMLLSVLSGCALQEQQEGLAFRGLESSGGYGTEGTLGESADDSADASETSTEAADGGDLPACSGPEDLEDGSCVDRGFRRTIAGDPSAGQGQARHLTVEIDRLKLVTNYGGNGNGKGSSWVYVVLQHSGATRSAIGPDLKPVKMQVQVSVDRWNGCLGMTQVVMDQDMHDGEVWEGYVECQNLDMLMCGDTERLAEASVRFVQGMQNRLFRQICGSDSCLLGQILGQRREGIAFAA